MATNPLLEAALENVEAVVDTLTSNELVRAIPVVGTALKVLKGARDIRDRLFAAKLLRFIQDLDSVRPETKERLRRKMADDPDEAKKVGETALIIIERSSAIQKAHLIAVLFLAYADDQISASEFRRLSAVVDQGFLDDLMEFLSRDAVPTKSADLFMQYLAPTGLTSPVPGATWADLTQLYYEATPLGDKMRNAYAYGRALLA